MRILKNEKLGCWEVYLDRDGRYLGAFDDVTKKLPGSVGPIKFSTELTGMTNLTGPAIYSREYNTPGGQKFFLRCTENDAGEFIFEIGAEDRPFWEAGRRQPGATTTGIRALVEDRCIKLLPPLEALKFVVQRIREKDTARTFNSSSDNLAVKDVVEPYLKWLKTYAKTQLVSFWWELTIEDADFKLKLRGFNAGAREKIYAMQSLNSAAVFAYENLGVGTDLLSIT